MATGRIDLILIIFLQLQVFDAYSLKCASCKSNTSETLCNSVDVETCELPNAHCHTSLVRNIDGSVTSSRKCMVPEGPIVLYDRCPKEWMAGRRQQKCFCHTDMCNYRSDAKKSPPRTTVLQTVKVPNNGNILKCAECHSNKSDTLCPTMNSVTCELTNAYCSTSISQNSDGTVSSYRQCMVPEGPFVVSEKCPTEWMEKRKEHKCFCNNDMCNSRLDTTTMSMVETPETSTTIKISTKVIEETTTIQPTTTTTTTILEIDETGKISADFLQIDSSTHSPPSSETVSLAKVSACSIATVNIILLSIFSVLVLTL